MTIKDWISILVPIFCNGILLFLFQSFVTAKIQAKREIEHKKHVFSDRFFQYIIEAIDKTISIQTKIENLNYAEIRSLEYMEHLSKMLNYVNSFEVLKDFREITTTISKKALQVEVICNHLKHLKKNFDGFSMDKILNWENGKDEIFDVDDINGIVSRVLAGLMDLYKPCYDQRDIDIIISRIAKEKREQNKGELNKDEIYRIQSIAEAVIKRNEESKGFLGRTRIKEVSGHDLVFLESNINAVLLAEENDVRGKALVLVREKKKQLEELSFQCIEA